MKESFILMSTPMIHAMQREIDPKSETRRIVKGAAFEWLETFTPEYVALPENHLCPYGYAGDILLIKEAAWMWCERVPNGTTPTGRPKWHYVPLFAAPRFYVADHLEKPTIKCGSPDNGNEWGWRFKIGRFLPRWAIRIKREVTNIRIERLQDISAQDALSEGIEDVWSHRHPRPFSASELDDMKHSYRVLWETINGAGSWDANPYVWVISFKRIKL